MSVIRFDVLTLFPELFGDFLSTGLVEKARKQGLLSISIYDLRKWAQSERGMIDDRPFGGGDGMVMAPEPLGEALSYVKERAAGRKIIYLTPEGNPFTAARAKSFAEAGGAVLLCGRYAGIDERIRELFVEEEISIGDYVLMGGELPAMVVMEASARFCPGVLGNADSAENDSFAKGILEGPLYTRPRVYREREVPEVLLSGNHQEIESWRSEMARQRTLRRRPDLLKDIS